MLTFDQRDRIDVVLVSPRNPLNIGAVARAMANFGLSHLTVVAPYAPHWREARSAIGAPELLQSAKEFQTLQEALADCTFVAGTGTLTHRKPQQPVLSLPDLAPVFAQQLDRGARVALIFGPEKHGLTRDDLSHCNVLVSIPTDPRQPSMNLGQAVAVCLYELARGITPGAIGAPRLASFPQKKSQTMGHAEQGTTDQGTTEHGNQQSASGEPPANSAALDRLAGLIEETMTAADYSPRAMQAANRHDVRLLLRRLAPSALDTRRMLGLFRRIIFRLHRSAVLHDHSSDG